MNEDYKGIVTEPKELSKGTVFWTLGIIVLVIALMFASIVSKGSLFYGAVAFGVMTAVIVHMIFYILSNSSRTKFLLFLHGVIWVFTISIAIYLRFGWENKELSRFGVAYQAPVIDLYSVRGGKYRHGRRFMARIRYEVRGKVYVKSIANTDRILQISDTVRIIYSSKDPVLFGVSTFVKRRIEDSLDTAKFKDMGRGMATIDDPIAKDGDRFPQFRGGPSAFYEYLSNHLVYPPTGIVNRKAGLVRLSFVIDLDGTIQDVQVTKGIDQLYDEAAVKVLKGSPKWLPGIRNGKPIKVKYNIPIRFSL